MSELSGCCSLDGTARGADVYAKNCCVPVLVNVLFIFCLLSLTTSCEPQFLGQLKLRRLILLTSHKPRWESGKLTFEPRCVCFQVCVSRLYSVFSVQVHLRFTSLCHLNSRRLQAKCVVCVSGTQGRETPRKDLGTP